MKGEDFTATVTLGNPDVLVGSGTPSLVPDTKVVFFIHTSFILMLQLLWSVQKPLLHPPGVVVAHYLQSITAALALGGELVYHRRPGEEGSVMSLVGRYTGQHGTRQDVMCHSHPVRVLAAHNRSLWFLQVATTSPRWPSARPELTPPTTTKQMSRWDARLPSVQLFHINQLLGS